MPVNTDSHILSRDRQRVGGNTARRVSFFAFGFSGMAALMYEVLWTRELQLVLGSTVYAVSTMLTAFMTGLTLGAFIGGKLADRTGNLFLAFAAIEAGIGVFGLATIPLIFGLAPVYFFLYSLFGASFYLFMIAQFLLAFAVMLVPTTLMGATFPVVAKIQATSLKAIGVEVGGVYSINTLGAIIGSFAAGFVVVPLVGVRMATIIAACINLAIATVMVMLSGSGRRPSMVVGIVLLILLAALPVMWAEPSPFPMNLFTVPRYRDYAGYQADVRSLTTRFLRDGVYGRVAVLESGGDLNLVNGGRIEGSTTKVDQVTTSLSAYLPLAVHPAPRNVLVIGLGTGLTLRDALGWPGVERVEVVEINRDVVEAARLFVGDAVIDDPRVSIIIGDGRNVLAMSDKRWDVISSEPSYPTSTGVSHLFTQEFYQLVTLHLTEDGVFCQWIPLYLTTQRSFLALLAAYTVEFPQTSVWFLGDDAIKHGTVPDVGDAMFIGTLSSSRKDASKIHTIIDTVAGNHIPASLVLTPDVARVLAKRATRANSDDWPILEFDTLRAILNPAKFARRGGG